MVVHCYASLRKMHPCHKLFSGEEFLIKIDYSLPMLQSLYCISHCIALVTELYSFWHTSFMMRELT